MRNYRAGLAKWQSADPMGYPDGWNQLAYCNNAATSAVDLWGCVEASETSKANMFEVDPKRIKANKAELGAKMEEYRRKDGKLTSLAIYGPYCIIAMKNGNIPNIMKSLCRRLSKN